MKNNIKKAISTLNNLQEIFKNIEQENERTKELFKLSELNLYVERFCTDNSVTKSEICTLADISSTTLTSTMKNPEKASMTTITSIGKVVGYDVFIGRNNV